MNLFFVTQRYYFSDCLYIDSGCPFNSRQFKRAKAFKGEAYDGDENWPQLYLATTSKFRFNMVDGSGTTPNRA